jgi:predicted transcriptional regulator
MAATSLKLPDDLKQRLARLAADSGQTTHAYMVEALRDAAERAEQRRAFAADADAAEAEALAIGTAYALEPAFDYLAARAAGRPARKPRPRPWRASR